MRRASATCNHSLYVHKYMQGSLIPPYNLFSRKDAPELYCAIPEDRPVPDFINGDWQFMGVLASYQCAPGGFIHKVAATSVQMNGYYVFMRYDPPPFEDKQKYRSISDNPK